MTQMGMVRWEPFLRDFGTLAGRFNHLFDTSFPIASNPTLGHDVAGWYPAVDIYDEGEAILLEAELPGFRREGITIRVENGVLLLTGERRRAEAENGHRRTALRSERPFGRFTRSFPLPTTVESQKIEASYRDGILRVTLPKTEASRPRQIDVEIH